MRYFYLFLLTISFLTIMFFLRPNDEENELKSATRSETPISIKTEEHSSKDRESIQSASSFDVSDSVGDLEQLNNLGQDIIDEVTECERKFDETLSVPINEISSIDNQSLIYVLEEFDELKLSSPKLGQLMGALSKMSNKNLSQNKNLVDSLSLVRPCRPFEKINFINELTKRFKDNENDEFLRGKIQASVRRYLNKELEHSVNLSTINMLSNVVMSLLDEGVFDDSMKETCEVLIEDLENDFDDLVDLAEETLENENIDFDSNLLKKEILLSKKYKDRLLEIVQKI